MLKSLYKSCFNFIFNALFKYELWVLPFNFFCFLCIINTLVFHRQRFIVAVVAGQWLILPLSVCVAGGGSRPVLPSAAPSVPSSWHLRAGLCGLRSPH